MKLTQHKRILRYMQEFGSITPMEAFSVLGITKLATRIGELIQNGHEIIKTRVDTVNRYDEPTHYMRYSIKREQA